ncbi:hypothetical protein, conserved [Trypanosoma brucei gambiense DAL972]|uniref:Uncharacterized protein n=2 Tax=Trypanosoma brucei TaxID=5691 RepID=C9ZXT3_TRYB9|nr:hypothetical protein, conserved [Trypanosoma brucei gambiense DAL972]CBH14228.1 hypothetical protein, conserved [Trypanosoma brucei gambiense DAL972]|eukprot:XP_011776498.1 hypothetical protein, conserved [Trypanosoma brucei gambiense DAL972]
MSTTTDFVGRNCPHCSAVDSLQTDDVMGEVACTACALVVAMGLEENVFTRYNENATYEDVDHHRERNANPTAATSAAGSLSAADPHMSSTSSKVVLHPTMLNCMRGLHKKAVLPEPVLDRGIELARAFVGGRRARGQRVERQPDVAAACLMIAAEEAQQPLPLAEVRCLDSSLGDVELRRADIVRELHLEDSERRLRDTFADNLLVKYILKLGLQVSLYLPHCKRLLTALGRVEALAGLTVADRVTTALLLARTAQTLSWEQGTHISKGKECDLGMEAIYANFSSKAHLEVTKVNKIMHLAVDVLPLIQAAFQDCGEPTAGKRKVGKNSEPEASGGTKRVKREET